MNMKDEEVKISSINKTKLLEIIWKSKNISSLISRTKHRMLT